MEEGKRQQIVEQLRCDLERAHVKIRDLETRLNSASGDMRELKTDVKHILAAIQSMESKLDRHIEVQP